MPKSMKNDIRHCALFVYVIFHKLIFVCFKLNLINSYRQEQIYQWTPYSCNLDIRRNIKAIETEASKAAVYPLARLGKPVAKNEI